MSHDELEELIGTPVFCARCSRHDRAIVVGFVTLEEGRPALTPAEFVRFDDPDYRPRYVPAFRRRPESMHPVELRCKRCRKSCGQWKAMTINKRLKAGIRTVP